jgi:hypothetical protein
VYQANRSGTLNRQAEEVKARGIQKKVQEALTGCARTAEKGKLFDPLPGRLKAGHRGRSFRQ